MVDKSPSTALDSIQAAFNVPNDKLATHEQSYKADGRESAWAGSFDIEISKFVKSAGFAARLDFYPTWASEVQISASSLASRFICWAFAVIGYSNIMYFHMRVPAGCMGSEVRDQV